MSSIASSIFSIVRPSLNSTSTHLLLESLLLLLTPFIYSELKWFNLCYWLHFPLWQWCRRWRKRICF